jgi:hypothetical protein
MPFVSTRQGRFQLAKQTGQTAHFARIELEATPAPSDAIVFREAAHGWETAIEAGILDALDTLRSAHSVAASWQVVVKSFVGLVTDTTDEDAKLAAFMALVRAFPECPQPALIWNASQQWELVGVTDA